MPRRRAISNKVVLITGGGRGIGRETALFFASKGAKVVISDVDAEALRETEQNLRTVSQDALALEGDVTCADDAARVVRTILDRFGQLDVLINNAGVSSRATLENTSIDVFNKVVTVNFLGAATMTKMALEAIRRSKGSVVFISSVAGLKGLPGTAAYCASKMALRSFSESLRCEVMRDGVHVGLIYLGFTQNDPDKTFFAGDGQVTVLRPYKYSFTQQQVAQRLHRMISRRRRLMVLSALGKAARLAYLVLPRISDRALAARALNTGMYKT